MLAPDKCYEAIQKSISSHEVIVSNPREKILPVWSEKLKADLSLTLPVIILDQLSRLNERLLLPITEENVDGGDVLPLLNLALFLKPNNKKNLLLEAPYLNTPIKNSIKETGKYEPKIPSGNTQAGSPFPNYEYLTCPPIALKYYGFDHVCFGFTTEGLMSKREALIIAGLTYQLALNLPNLDAKNTAGESHQFIELFRQP